MSRLGVVHPTSLLARELRRALEERRELWSELRLLSSREEEVGILTEVAGAAAVVDRLDDASFDDLDLVFLCDDLEHTRPLLDRLPNGTRAVLLAADAESSTAAPLVAGVNLDDGSQATELSLSPHPGVVALARLLAPLRPLGLEEATTTLLQPASMHDEAALDEVFSQTRALLSFQSVDRSGIFGAQIAFNLLPTGPETLPLGDHLRQILGEEVTIALQVVQAGVFHGMALSVCCRFDAPLSLEALRSALSAAPGLELVDNDALGPVDSASRSEVLIGNVRQDGSRAGIYWLWAVTDHLVLAACNAVEICLAQQPS